MTISNWNSFSCYKTIWFYWKRRKGVSKFVVEWLSGKLTPCPWLGTGFCLSSLVLKGTMVYSPFRGGDKFQEQFLGYWQIDEEPNVWKHQVVGVSEDWPELNRKLQDSKDIASLDGKYWKIIFVLNGKFVDVEILEACAAWPGTIGCREVALGFTSFLLSYSIQCQLYPCDTTSSLGKFVWVRCRLEINREALGNELSAKRALPASTFRSPLNMVAELCGKTKERRFNFRGQHHTRVPPNLLVSNTFSPAKLWR